jgi:3-deoxy-D-manno-octulosonate 8-phosphate phosphatase KdsC-like HAD superfamily phosphatase
MSSKIINFYKGWPTKGPYVNKLKEIFELVSNYLHKIPKYTTFTAIFDIDDTLVYTDPLNILPYDVNKTINKKFILPENKDIVKIAKTCNKLGIKVIIITARPYDSESSSIKNLELLNIKYDEIYHNKNYPDKRFKIKLKQNLSKKHNIILSIGDSWIDLQGLDNCLCIKLPDTEDINSYFSFNNKKYHKI